jgi:hypothetical protein
LDEDDDEADEEEEDESVPDDTDADAGAVVEADEDDEEDVDEEEDDDDDDDDDDNDDDADASVATLVASSSFSFCMRTSSKEPSLANTDLCAAICKCTECINNVSQWESPNETVTAIAKQGEHRGKTAHTSSSRSRFSLFSFFR